MFPATSLQCSETDLSSSRLLLSEISDTSLANLGQQCVSIRWLAPDSLVCFGGVFR